MASIDTSISERTSLDGRCVSSITRSSSRSSILSTDDAVSGWSKSDSPGFQKVETMKAKLLSLTELTGPGGLSFSKCRAQRKNAIFTLKRLQNIDNLDDEDSELLIKAKEVVDDKELEKFLDTQLQCRKLLGIAPLTREDHERFRVAKEERRAKAISDAQRRASRKRKFTQSAPKLHEDRMISRTTPPYEQQNPQLKFVSQSNEYYDRSYEQHPAGQTSKLPVDPLLNRTLTSKQSLNVKNSEKEEVDLRLRLVLVDISEEDGKIGEETRLRVEEAVLTQLSESKNDAFIFFEGGFVFGHRTMDCANEESLKFFKKTVEKLNFKKGNVKAIAWSEINTVNSLRGWVWVPKPYLSKEKLITLIRMQNPGYNTRIWYVLAEGRQRDYGQHFLIKISNDNMPALEENNMKVKVGMYTSQMILDGNYSHTVSGVDSVENTTLGDDGGKRSGALDASY